MFSVKLQGPKNFGGFSHDGETYEADEDGVIEVPAHLPTEVIAAHGLVPAEDRPKKVLAKVEDAKSGKKGLKTSEAEDAEDAKAGGSK